MLYLQSTIFLMLCLIRLCGVGTDILGQERGRVGEKAFEVDALGLASPEIVLGVLRAANVVFGTIVPGTVVGIHQRHGQRENPTQIAFVLALISGELVNVAQIVAQDQFELCAGSSRFFRDIVLFG